MAYVYKHIRLDNDEVFYIGISKDTNYKRAYSKYFRNRHWHYLTKKHGYKVEIIFENLSIEDAIKKEIELISLYGRKDLGKGSLVNMTDGGDGQINMSEETKQKLRTYNTGKTIENHWSKSEEGKCRIKLWTSGDNNPSKRKDVAQKISKAKKGKKNPKVSEFAKKRKGELNSFYGKSHSDEFKQMMRDLKTGVPLTEQHKISLSMAGKNRGPYNYKDKQQTCPHCGTTGGGGNMKRYHFDNCKSLKK